MKSSVTQREQMVETQLRRRGIRNERVLAAMGEVPREQFVPEELEEYAYHDGPLPIGSEQTISQPYIVAAMVAALELDPTDRVLEVGAGSGYAAAVMSRVVASVYAIERHGELAEKAAERVRRLGYDNVHIAHGDGSVGWPDAAPFDAVVVAAAGPEVPPTLRQQLAVGGRMIIPVGPTRLEQRLIRMTRTSEDDFESEELEAVRFVPLIGEEGWADELGAPAAVEEPRRKPTIVEQIAQVAEPFEGLEPDLGRLLERIGDARVVLLGEPSHGTSEFYRVRSEITKALVEQKGFRIVAVEADWPDAARIDGWIRYSESPPPSWQAFARFPTWMWRNVEVRDLVDWLRAFNGSVTGEDEQVGFYGLDLYSLYTSIGVVLEYLEDVDPEAARTARQRYACLEPWERDPAAYGRAALSRRIAECEDEVLANLSDLLQSRLEYAATDGYRFLDAVQNARLVSNAERYYRIMYYGSRESWNLRDSHMFSTLQAVRAFHGAASKAVVWEHNSHLGDARATEMGASGEHNVGQLCRQEYGANAYLIGCGTDRGTVAAASEWDGPMEVKRVRPSHRDSYERLCASAEHGRFLLPLRIGDAGWELRRSLSEPRLERAIGVIYRPETELQSHYFQAVLPHQFDEWIWADETHAVTPLDAEDVANVPDTYPFGV